MSPFDGLELEKPSCITRVYDISRERIHDDRVLWLKGNWPVMMGNRECNMGMQGAAMDGCTMCVSN